MKDNTNTDIVAMITTKKCWNSDVKYTKSTAKMEINDGTQ